MLDQHARVVWHADLFAQIETAGGAVHPGELLMAAYPRAYVALFTNPELANGRPCPRGAFCTAKQPDTGHVPPHRWIWSHIGPFQHFPDHGELEPSEVLYACDVCLTHFAEIYDHLFVRTERGRRHLWRRSS